MEIGKVVAFFEHKKIICAVCLEASDGKYHLLTEENREVTLASGRISHVSSRNLKLTLPRDALVEQLKGIAEARKS